MERLKKWWFYEWQCIKNTPGSWMYILGIIFSVILTGLSIAILLSGCGGPEFTTGSAVDALTVDDSGLDAQVQEAADAGHDSGSGDDAGWRDGPPSKPHEDAADASQAAEATTREAVAPDAPTEAATKETGPTCTPFPSGSQACPTTCGTCSVNSAATPPAFFVASPANYQGCGTLPTPAACVGCREAFTCVCVTQNWTLTVAVCGSTAIQATCDDSTGVPVVTCH